MTRLWLLTGVQFGAFAVHNDIAPPKKLGDMMGLGSKGIPRRGEDRVAPVATLVVVAKPVVATPTPFVAALPLGITLSAPNRISSPPGLGAPST